MLTPLLTTSLLCAQLAMAPPPAAAQPATPQTPALAVQMALADLATLPEIARPSQIYFWNPTRSPDVATALIFALNAAVSRSNVNVVPVVVGDGSLLRADLLLLAPKDADQFALSAVLADLSNVEPYFHVVKQVAVEVAPYKHTDGKVYKRKVINQSLIAPHVGVEAGLLLEETTASPHPIFDARWFITKALTTLDGGVYYRLIGLTPETTQEQYLLSRGASERQVKGLESDERAALFRSKVTGKQRRIDMFRSAGVRVSAGTGLVAVTHDVFDGDTQAERDPFRNLLEFVDRGREIILERPNVWPEFTLWDANGRLVDSAPDKLAVDHLVPAPHTKRLQSGISCLRCHGPDDGWQPFENEVGAMLSRDLDAFDDLSSLVSIPDTLRRLAGLYSGDLAEALRLGRNAYSQVVWKATGRTVPDASNAVSTVYASYVYDQVTAVSALRELGVIVTDEVSAPQRLTEVLGQLPPAEDGISPEDPILAALKLGIAVNRDRWELVYADAMTRAAAWHEQQAANQQQQQSNQPTQPQQPVEN